MSLWQSIIDYIFPRECVGCGQEGATLCPSCFVSLEFLPRTECYLCHTEVTGLGICARCQDSFGLNEVMVATRYSGTATGQLVEKLKYDFLESGAESLAEVLAEWLARNEVNLNDFVIVPIPLHRKRYAERGFNQAELLADKLGQLLSFKIDKYLLIRSRYTLQQAKLDRSERLSNLVGAFFINDQKPVPKRVLLLDDVLTTGSTFREAAFILRKFGVSEVVCLAVCHG